MSNGEIPLDDNRNPAIAGYDATGHQVVAAEIVSVTTDSTTGIQHGALNVNASFSASSLAINDPTITSQKATVDASGNLHVQAVGAGTAGSPSGGVVSIQGVGSGTAVPVSAASLPLPTGAATVAKQPALGTAGSASTDVITVQGIASMTALKTDGSGVTQPVSGTVSVNALPAGSNTLGGVELVDSAGTNKATIDGSGNIHTLESNSSSISTNTSNTASGIGAVGDSAYTSGNGSVVAVLKGIFGRIGAALGFDNTNVLKVSLYGKNSVAGDTSLLADSTGRVLIGRNCVAAYTLASTTTSGSTQNSGDLTVGNYTEISIDINTTAQAGTNPTLQYFYERKAADGIYYVLWQSAVLTAATNTLSTSIGTGMAYNQSLGATGRIRWVIGGTATPTFTHTINIQGK